MTKREKIEDRLKSEKPTADPFKPHPAMELEIARRLARQSCHYGSRVLADCTHYMPRATRVQYMMIVSGLMELRNHLDALSPIARAAELLVEELEHTTGKAEPPGGSQ